MNRKRTKPSDRGSASLEDLVLALGESRGSPEACRVVFVRAVESLGANGGAVFLIESDGASLRGAYGMWDWTRTSFRVWLDDWPNVKRAIETNQPVWITRSRARALEADWFEPHGITSTVAAPLVAKDGRALGVLFIDYTNGKRRLAPRHLAFAGRFARAWADVIESSRDPRDEGRPEALAGRSNGDSPALHDVTQLMSQTPVMVDARVSAQVAHRIAAASAVHHLLAVEDGRLCGVLCRCDLETARPFDPIKGIVRASVVHVGPSTTIEQAARTMLEEGVGCLPVMDESGQVLGVLTRGDLRRAGLLGNESGVDLCATCGSSHALRSTAAGAPVFCESCLKAPPDDSLEALYYTLGGGG